MMRRSANEYQITQHEMIDHLRVVEQRSLMQQELFGGLHTQIATYNTTLRDELSLMRECVAFLTTEMRNNNDPTSINRRCIDGQRRHTEALDVHVARCLGQLTAVNERMDRFGRRLDNMLLSLESVSNQTYDHGGALMDVRNVILDLLTEMNEGHNLLRMQNAQRAQEEAQDPRERGDGRSHETSVELHPAPA